MPADPLRPGDVAQVVAGMFAGVTFVVDQGGTGVVAGRLKVPGVVPRTDVVKVRAEECVRVGRATCGAEGEELRR